MRRPQPSVASIALVYTIALGAVVAVTAVMLLIGIAVPIEAFPLVYVLLVGLIAWRYGPGPGRAATVAAVILADFAFVQPAFSFTVPNAGDLVRLLMLLVAGIAVTQVVHLQRERQSVLAARETALATRLRLLEDISRQIVQSLNGDEIVRTVADQTQRVIDYHHFRFYRHEEGADRLILAKSVARGEPYDRPDWDNLAIPVGTGVTGIAARNRAPVLVADASRDPRMFYPPGAKRLVEAVLAVPMVAGDRLFGVLSLARLGAGSLTADDQSLMEAISAQAALALANAEQYEAAEDTIAALAAIEALEVPAGDGSAIDLYQRIVTTVVGLAHADAGGLRLRDPRDRRYQLVAAAPPGSDVQPSRAEPVEQSEAAWLVESRAPYHNTNPQTDPRLPRWARDAAAAASVQSTVFLPLRSQNELLGWLALDWNRPVRLGPEALRRLKLVAAQAALSLQIHETIEEERNRAGMLAQLERMRREFMQIASHELRTPLSVIRGYASLLEDGSLGSVTPESAKALRILSEKAAEMGAQVERMLFLARLEDSQATYAMDQVDLVTLVREATARVQPQVDLRGGTIDATLPRDPVLVRGDSERLGMAIDNLLENAAKFTIDPPRIQLRLHVSGGEAEISVQDNGIGIPEQAIPRLFEKFYRVDDPQLRVGGTGIGLYLVRQVVDAHGGRIAVESPSNAGTRFRITLPRVTQSHLAGSGPGSEALDQEGTRPSSPSQAPR